MPTKVTATVRMYRLNELGDCFLVSFAAGSKKSHLLVDCGSFRNSGDSIKRLNAVVAQIKKDVGLKGLDVVVGTHQHNDHLSGFLHCQKAFESIGVRQVWLSWLDNPKDALAQQIGKKHNNILSHLAVAHDGLNNAKAKGAARRRIGEAREVVSDMLGFFGAAAAGQPPEVPAKATVVLKGLGKSPVDYLEPGFVREMPGMPVGSVRVHVLGPPRDHASLYRADPRTGESYDPKLTGAARVSAGLARAFAAHGGTVADEDRDYPFNSESRCSETPTASLELLAQQARYRASNDEWRTIDTDWMLPAESLALYLNDYTNDSSLALAIELVGSGKVLLFAADAQTGNWSSWKDVAWAAGHPGTNDLLARTAFYKVGHHASHNATLVEAFEKMGGEDLCAFIPVHKQDPNITKQTSPWKMPATKLFARLVEKTHGRVLQMDNDNPAECDLSKPAVKQAWKKSGHTVTVDDMAITVKI